MKQKLLSIAVVLIFLLASIANFNSALMGGAPRLWGTILSVLYVVCFSSYVAFSRRNKIALVFSLVWSLISLLGFAVALVNNIYFALNGEHLIIDFILPVALLVFPSFYGVVEIFGNAISGVGTVFAVVICVIWSSVCIFNLRRKNEYNP